MRQEVAFLPRRAKAKGKRKPHGFATEGIDVIWKEEGRNPALVSVPPGPPLKNTAPDADREGAGNNNVLRRVRRGAWREAMTTRAGLSSRGGGSGSGTNGEAVHMKLVDALSGSVW